MNNSNISEYVHPDYLSIDGVLDHIGKATCKDWDSGYIEKSRTPDRIIGIQADGSKRGIQLTSITLLIPDDEAMIRNILKDSESKIAPKEYKNSQELSYKPVYNSKLRDEINIHEFPIQTICLIGPDQLIVSNSTKKFNLENKEDRINLSNLLNLTRTINTLRDFLVLDKLCLYVKYDREYKKIRPSDWEDKNHWNKLLIEGHFRGKPLKGKVYCFKKDVKALLENNLQTLPCTDDQQIRESLEKLFSSKRPWLKLLNELALSLSDEEIETKLIKQLKDDIEKKARSLDLVPSGNKVSLIATFLRAPEQEKGTAYRSAKKKEKSKNK